MNKLDAWRQFSGTKWGVESCKDAVCKKLAGTKQDGTQDTGKQITDPVSK